MFTSDPPSNVIVAPFTYAPARLARNNAVPATSSGVPMRERGTPAMICSPTTFKVWAVTVWTMISMGRLRKLQDDSYFYFGKVLKVCR
jgi:hypothetical protein